MQMDEVGKKPFLVREYVDLFSHTQKEVLVLAGAMQMDKVRKKPFLVREYVDLFSHTQKQVLDFAGADTSYGQRSEG